MGNAMVTIIFQISDAQAFKEFSESAGQSDRQ